VPPPAALRHSAPRLDELQPTHSPPAAPHIVGSVPATQVEPLQQPPLHGCVDEQVPVHTCWLVSQAWFAGQSLVTLQPQVPARQAPPSALVLQSVHAFPSAPQILFALPALHTPPEQQPPLHGCVDEQRLVQACWLVSQAQPTRQSLEALQPQLPPPVTASHTAPAVEEAQGWHRPPPLPHADAMVPVTQVVPSQQPPLHAWPAAQEVEQTCVDGSHAWPVGQSLALMQPQLSVPATQP
jgi:hypothetical protein